MAFFPPSPPRIKFIKLSVLVKQESVPCSLCGAQCGRAPEVLSWSLDTEVDGRGPREAAGPRVAQRIRGQLC